MSSPVIRGRGRPIGDRILTSQMLMNRRTEAKEKGVPVSFPKPGLYLAGRPRSVERQSKARIADDTCHLLKYDFSSTISEPVNSLS